MEAIETLHNLGGSKLSLVRAMPDPNADVKESRYKIGSLSDVGGTGAVYRSHRCRTVAVYEGWPDTKGESIVDCRSFK